MSLQFCYQFASPFNEFKNVHFLVVADGRRANIKLVARVPWER